MILILFFMVGCGNGDLDRENADEMNNTKNEEIKNVNESEGVVEEEITIPESVNLEMPFQPQAPHGNWDQPYQDGCEEASLILAVASLNGETAMTPEEMDADIKGMVEWQNKMWGGHYDLNIRETGDMLVGYYNEKYTAELLYDWTWDDIKEALAQGYPVVLPLAGQQIGNPYYTSPGPVYHMLVIKGYDANGVITNDVGTKRGEDYRYTYDTLYSSTHDWDERDINLGRRAAIVVKYNQ